MKQQLQLGESDTLIAQRATLASPHQMTGPLCDKKKANRVSLPSIFEPLSFLGGDRRVPQDPHTGLSLSVLSIYVSYAITFS